MQAIFVIPTIFRSCSARTEESESTFEDLRYRWQVLARERSGGHPHLDASLNFISRVPAHVLTPAFRTPTRGPCRQTTREDRSRPLHFSRALQHVQHPIYF